MSKVPNYNKTLDRLTYMIGELMPILMEFQGKIPRVFIKLKQTHMTIKPHAYRIHPKKILYEGLIFEIEFKTMSYSC